jgi:hypothetical protein
MADAISNNSSRDLWREARLIKGRNSTVPSNIDDCSNDDDISNLFASKYCNLYNSVPYDEENMNEIKKYINDKLMDENCSYNITIDNVTDAICKLKYGKGDGEEGLYSDHFINAPFSFHVILSLLFNSMVVHGFTPQSMLLGTMIPIPKNRKKSVCNSDNYRAIALSSIFSKVLDIIIISKEQNVLLTSSLQFGFKHGVSTTQCTFTMLETIDYYNFNQSNVYCLMLDATKAFDRVKYCKLFSLLLKRNMSPLLLRLLLHMYTSQSLQVKWGSKTSYTFGVSNGVKQGGVLSPILFAVYMDELLNKLESSGTGCHVGAEFVGAVGYADDLTLMAPSLSSLKSLVNMCEQYAREFDIQFNGSKSQLMCFKGRGCSTNSNSICVNGVKLNYVSNATHLGHEIDVSDKGGIIDGARKQFCKQFNMFMSDFGNVSSHVKNKLFVQYCCSFYGSPLWPLHSNNFSSLCVTWRKSLRQLWRVPFNTHCDIVTLLGSHKPLDIQIKCRFNGFMSKCLQHTNNVVRTVAQFAIRNPMSVTGRNYRNVCMYFNNDCEMNASLVNWNKRAMDLAADVNVLSELIKIRDNTLDCQGFTNDEICVFITDICID